MVIVSVNCTKYEARLRCQLHLPGTPQLLPDALLDTILKQYVTLSHGIFCVGWVSYKGGSDKNWKCAKCFFKYLYVVIVFYGIRAQKKSLNLFLNLNSKYIQQFLIANGFKPNHPSHF